MIAAAFGMGALAGVGIELPANKAQMSIYGGVIKTIQEEKVGFTDSSQQKYEFQVIHLDINEVIIIGGISCFYCFIALPRNVTWSLCCFVLRSKQLLPAMPCSSQCACAFWNGMGRKTQLAILRLCASSSTLDSIAVFRDPYNWQGYTEGASFQTSIHSS
jgi:hypothetical protein